MGFGYLFIGFLIFCNPLYATYVFPVSALFMLCGTWLLAQYNRGFKIARNTLLIWLVPSLFSLVLDILSSSGVTSAFIEAAKVPSRIASYGFEMLFVLFLLTGIQMIAQETSLPKIIKRARLWRTVSVIYYALIFLSVSAFGATNEGKLLSAALFIFGIVFKIAVTALIWSCYMWICLEGDEDMPERPLRFKWMNDLRDRYNSTVLSPKSKTNKKQTKNKGGKKK